MNRRGFFKNLMIGVGSIFGSIAAIKQQRLEDEKDVEDSLKALREPKSLELTSSTRNSATWIVTYYNDPKEAVYPWTDGEPIGGK